LFAKIEIFGVLTFEPFYKMSLQMKVLFRSKDFASITGGGFGFNNRRPMASSWHYQGRVQHSKWQGTFTCHWDGPEVQWAVRGDERLFALAAALKSKGLKVEVMRDDEQEKEVE
jgi:hypothetical protein